MMTEHERFIKRVERISKSLGQLDEISHGITDPRYRLAFDIVGDVAESLLDMVEDLERMVRNG